MRVVQHDPLLLNLVNILTWIPQSLWTELATYEEKKMYTYVCVIEKKQKNEGWYFSLNRDVTSRVSQGLFYENKKNEK